jgi:hypothetical protein
MVLTELSVGKVASVRVIFRNTGQNLARDVTTHAVLWSAPVTAEDSPSPELPARPPINFPSKSTVGTAGRIEIHAHTGTAVTKEQFDAIQNRLFRLYAHAIADFESDEGKHSTEVYGWYDAVFRDFVKCDKHNQAT